LAKYYPYLQERHDTLKQKTSLSFVTYHISYVHVAYQRSAVCCYGNCELRIGNDKHQDFIADRSTDAVTTTSRACPDLIVTVTLKIRQNNDQMAGLRFFCIRTVCTQINELEFQVKCDSVRGTFLLFLLAKWSHVTFQSFSQQISRHKV
jgi:hypothetical protein